MSGNANGQGSNSVVVRQFNERVVLAALRRLGEASKADLARQVNITQNAAGQIVRDLERQNLVCEIGKRTGLRGQPATLLRLDPKGAYAIGIKLGRRWLDSILVDFSGTVIKARRHEREFPLPEPALRIIRDDIAALKRAIPARERSRLTGIGLAMPYNLGSWRRELDIPEATCAAGDGFDLGAKLRASLDLPVFVENDGNAVAVAELFGGHGRELDDFAVVYIGTAVGGGVVLGGSYRRGANGNAGDIGLMPVPPSRLPSAPPALGGNDILLNRASISSLIRHLRHAEVPIRNARDLEEAIAARRGLVGEWLEDCADALVGPLLAIGAMLDLQAIVIDGNLPRDLVAQLIERVRELLNANVPEARQPPVLRMGTMGPNAAALGAAILPLHSSFGPDQELLFGQ
ncbi:MAG TPA: ROK family transcriptional regulator [Acetobacteraceae bacterium]|nr:ROK family transcriptional regulator [Acetobacteraceae bacterium]